MMVIGGNTCNRHWNRQHILGVGVGRFITATVLESIMLLKSWQREQEWQERQG